MTPNDYRTLAAIAASRALHQIITHTDFEMIWDAKPDTWRDQLSTDIANDIAAHMMRVELETGPIDASADTVVLVRGSAVAAAIQYASTHAGMSIGDVIYSARQIEAFMNRDHG
jgi:hypothetical protein